MKRGNIFIRTVGKHKLSEDDCYELSKKLTSCLKRTTLEDINSINLNLLILSDKEVSESEKSSITNISNIFTNKKSIFIDCLYSQIRQDSGKYWQTTYDLNASLLVIGKNIEDLTDQCGVYLIKTDYADKTLYKIGQSNNVANRFLAIRTANPDAKLLGHIFTFNNTNLELEFHNKFARYRYFGEWFYANDEILNEYLNHKDFVPTS